MAQDLYLWEENGNQKREEVFNLDFIKGYRIQKRFRLIQIFRITIYKTHFKNSIAD